MKNDVFMKIVLSGILICLISITLKMDSEEPLYSPPPQVEVIDERTEIIQLAPDQIGIVDDGIGSGWEQLVIFEYNEESESYEVIRSLPYENYFNNPELFGIPTRSDG